MKFNRCFSRPTSSLNFRAFFLSDLSSLWRLKFLQSLTMEQNLDADDESDIEVGEMSDDEEPETSASGDRDTPSLDLDLTKTGLMFWWTSPINLSHFLNSQDLSTTCQQTASHWITSNFFFQIQCWKLSH